MLIVYIETIAVHFDDETFTTLRAAAAASDGVL